MTTKKRKRYSAQFKFQVALEAAKKTKTINQVASEYELHPNQVSRWREQLLEERTSSSAAPRPGNSEKGRPRNRTVRADRAVQDEAEMAHKKLDANRDAQRSMIEPTHPDLSMRRQRELIGLNRSSFYYQPATESPLNL